MLPGNATFINSIMLSYFFHLFLFVPINTEKRGWEKCSPTSQALISNEWDESSHSLRLPCSFTRLIFSSGCLILWVFWFLQLRGYLNYCVFLTLLKEFSYMSEHTGQGYHRSHIHVVTSVSCRNLLALAKLMKNDTIFLNSQHLTCETDGLGYI